MNRRSAIVIVLLLIVGVGAYLFFSSMSQLGSADRAADARAESAALDSATRRAATTDASGLVAARRAAAAQTSDEERKALARAFHAAVQAARARGRSTEAPAAVAAPVSPSGADAPQATLDPQYIRDAVRELRPLLAECYERALEEQPGLEGSLVVEFTIEGEPEVGGVVEDTTIADTSTLRHPSLDECVRETLYTLQLPAPEGSGSVQVRYPFRFSSGDEDANDGGVAASDGGPPPR